MTDRWRDTLRPQSLARVTTRNAANATVLNWLPVSNLVSLLLSLHIGKKKIQPLGQRHLDGMQSTQKAFPFPRWVTVPNAVALLQMVFIFTGSRLASSRPSTLGRVAENITTLSLAHNPINLIYFIQIPAQVFELSCPVTFIDTTSVQ